MKNQFLANFTMLNEIANQCHAMPEEVRPATVVDDTIAMAIFGADMTAIAEGNDPTHGIVYYISVLEGFKDVTIAQIREWAGEVADIKYKYFFGGKNRDRLDKNGFYGYSKAIEAWYKDNDEWDMDAIDELQKTL